MPLTNHTGGIQFQRRTLTALFADSRDYELLVLAAPAFAKQLRRGKRGGRHVEVGGGENCSFRRCTTSKRCFFCPQRPLPSNQKVRCQNLALPCIAPPSLIFTHAVAHHPHPFICLHTSFSPLSFSSSNLTLNRGGFTVCAEICHFICFVSFFPSQSPPPPPSFFRLWVRLKPGIHAHRCLPPPTPPHSHLLVSLWTPDSIWMPFLSWVLNADPCHRLLCP